MVADTEIWSSFSGPRLFLLVPVVVSRSYVVFSRQCNRSRACVSSSASET